MKVRTTAIARRSQRTCAALLFVLLLLASPESASTQSRPAAADTVRLRFRWPVGTVATVETTRFRERVTEKTDTVAGGARYRMQVQQHPEGLLIVYDSFDVSSATVAAGAGALQAVAERLADLVPSYVVSSSGEFKRVHDVAGIRARMNSVFGTMLQSADSTGRARASLDALVSEAVLNQIASQEWNTLVGMWIDADLVLGESYQLEDEAPIPLVPGARVRMDSEFAIRGRVPCRERGTTPECVEIHLLSLPDPQAMTTLIRQFMDRIASNPGLAGFGFESLDLQNELVLIIEPATLLPHRAQLTKRVKGVVRAGGKRGDISQRDIRTFRFTYR